VNTRPRGLPVWTRDYPRIQEFMHPAATLKLDDCGLREVATSEADWDAGLYSDTEVGTKFGGSSAY